MSKYIYYLILCGTLLLYCCGEHNPIMPSIKLDTQKNTNKDIILTADEEAKFNLIKTGFDAIIEYAENELKEHEANIKRIINEEHLKQSKNTLKKYPGFIEWLSNNSQKKKELANAFTPIYDALNEQRIKQSSTLTNKQLLINTFDCILKNPSNNQCNDNKYVYNEPSDQNFKNKIDIVFTIMLEKIYDKNTNEEMLEAMIQDILLNPNSKVADFIGINRLEAIVIKKLTDEEKQGLTFLKAALNDENKLKLFLTSDKDKVKEVLDYIYSESSKCSGDDAKKNTFKDAIKNYFSVNVINEQKLDEFKNQVTSSC